MMKWILPVAKQSGHLQLSMFCLKAVFLQTGKSSLLPCDLIGELDFNFPPTNPLKLSDSSKDDP